MEDVNREQLIRDKYKYRTAIIELLPHDFFVIKDKEDAEEGHLMLYPAKTTLGRVIFEDDDKVVLEQSIVRRKVDDVSPDHPALDNAGFIDVSKIYDIFPEMAVEFMPSDRLQKSASGIAIQVFQCATSGKLVTSVEELQKVEVLNPEDPEEVVDTLYVARSEIPR